MKIEQGYPKKVIGELDKTDSGWFFYVNKDCNMIHEETMRKMLKIINKLKESS